MYNMRRPYDLVALLRQEQRQEEIKKLEKELKEREHELVEDALEKEAGPTNHFKCLCNFCSVT